MLIQILEYLAHNGLIKDMPVFRDTLFNTALHINSVCMFIQTERNKLWIPNIYPTINNKHRVNKK